MSEPRLLQYRMTFTGPELALLDKSGDFDGHVRKVAARGLAAAIIKDGCSVMSETRPTPDPEDPQGGYMREVHWTVGLLNAGEVHSFAEQLAEAYQRGMNDAAGIAGAAAQRVRSSPSDGVCKWVIADALDNAARAIEGAAAASRTAAAAA